MIRSRYRVGRCRVGCSVGKPEARAGPTMTRTLYHRVSLSVRRAESDCLGVTAAGPGPDRRRQAPEDRGLEWARPGRRRGSDTAIAAGPGGTEQALAP